MCNYRADFQSSQDSKKTANCLNHNSSSMLFVKRSKRWSSKTTSMTFRCLQYSQTLHHHLKTLCSSWIQCYSVLIKCNPKDLIKLNDKKITWFFEVFLALVAFTYSGLDRSWAEREEGKTCSKVGKQTPDSWPRTIIWGECSTSTGFFCLFFINSSCKRYGTLILHNMHTYTRRSMYKQLRLRKTETGFQHKVVQKASFRIQWH